MSLPSSQVSPLLQNVVPKRKRSHRVRSGDVAITAPPATQSPYVVAPTATTFGVSVDPVSLPPKKRTRTARHARVASGDTVPALPVPGGTGYQQLPAVSVSHPAGLNAHTLRKRVSYGDLTPSDVAAVTAHASGALSEATPQLHPVHWATDVVDDESDSSGSESGSEAGYASGEGNPYVDDIAEEASDDSASGSEDDCEEGHVTPDASLPLPSPGIATAIRASPRSRTKTERGLYADTLITNGRASDLALHDDVRSDPSVELSTSRPPGRSRKDLSLLSSGTSAGAGDGTHAASAVRAGVVSQTSSSTGQVRPTVYLEDLDSPPLPSGKRSKVNKVKPSRSGEVLAVRTDLAGAAPSDGTSYLPVKTLLTSPSCAVPPTPGNRLAREGAAGGVAPEASVVSTGSSLTSLLDKLDAFVTAACRDSSPEQDDAEEASPSADADAPASSESTGVHSPSEPDDPSLRVMLPEIQEEQLRAFYLTLTCLGVFRAMVPLGQTVNNFDQPPYITIDDMASFFSRHSLQSVVAWLYFVGHGCYCTLSTMPRPLFSFDGKKMMYNSSTCVAMIAGVVIDCSIFKDGQQGGWSGATSTQGGRVLHSIRLLPFSQPWRRETTMIASVCDLPTNDSQSECMLSDGVEFATRASSSTPAHNRNKFPSPAVQKPSVPKSAPSTSARAKTGWPKSPAKPPTLASRAQSQYYHCLGFEDEVPIFDGRFSKGRHFLFRPEDFDNISTMPRITRDLDRFALVAVGYTPAVWSPGGQPRVNLNVQFIVLLGQAPKPAVLAKAGYGVE